MPHRWEYTAEYQDGETKSERVTLHTSIRSEVREQLESDRKRVVEVTDLTYIREI